MVFVSTWENYEIILLQYAMDVATKLEMLFMACDMWLEQFWNSVTYIWWQADSDVSMFAFVEIYMCIPYTDFHIMNATSEFIPSEVFL